MNKKDTDNIISALNGVWHDSKIALDKVELGDIEKKIYQQQMNDAKELIDKLNNAPTHSDRVKMINISANVAGIGLSEELSDLIVSLYELILEKRDSLTIKEIFTIKHEVKCRADAKARSEMLDKVSKKIEQ